MKELSDFNEDNSEKTNYLYENLKNFVKDGLHNNNISHLHTLLLKKSCFKTKKKSSQNIQELNSEEKSSTSLSTNSENIKKISKTNKIFKKKFEYWEDDLILKLVQKHGLKWDLIASFIPNRTKSMIKNRYYTKIKKENNIRGNPLCLSEDVKNVKEDKSSLQQLKQQDESEKNFDFSILDNIDNFDIDNFQDMERINSYEKVMDKALNFSFEEEFFDDNEWNLNFDLLSPKHEFNHLFEEKKLNDFDEKKEKCEEKEELFKKVSDIEKFLHQTKEKLQTLF